MVEHRSRVGAGVELAALGAGVDRGRQLVEQRRVELAAGKPAVHHLRIQAGDPGAQAAGNHLARQPGRVGVGAKQRKQRRQPAAGEALLAVLPDIGEKQVAECRVGEALAHRAGDGLPHFLFVDLIRARRWNRHHPERKAERLGLGLQHLDAHRMHRHPLRRLVDRGQQRANRDVAALPQGVHHPGAVFAARPGDQRLHLKRPGCRASASLRVASTTRGPGTTNSSPASAEMRCDRTAGTDASASQARSSSARSAFLRLSP